MAQTLNILMWLRRLSDLDTVLRRLEPGTPELASELAAIRDRLPTAILKHYDERRSRGRPAIASVSNGICGGCHLTLPSGRMADLRRADGVLQVCDNCGVFIFLNEEEQEASPAPATTKTRRRSTARNHKASDSLPT